MSRLARAWSFAALLVLALTCLVGTSVTPAQAALSVQLLSTNDYLDAEGYVVFVGELLNDGTITAQDVRVAIQLRDANGTVIETASTFATAFWLKPGERSPFRTRVYKPTGYASATYELAFVRESTHRANHDYALTVTEDVVDASGRRRLAGTIRNDSGQTGEFVEIIATFYGSDGRISDATFTFVEGQTSTLRAGATATWSLSTSRPSDTYRLLAESSDQLPAPPPSPRPSPTAAPSPPPAPGSRFAPVTPSRLLDTREALGAPRGPVSSNATVELEVAGRGSIPASGVTAVALNVTSTGSSANGFVTVFPATQTRPLASNLNYTRGQTIANLVVAGLGSDGRVALYNFGGGTHLVADVVGWYSDTDPAATSRHDVVTPNRLLDTRGEGIGARGAVHSGNTVTFPATGTSGVPATGVTAVVLNVTATGGTANGFVTAHASGQERPLASNLNYARGQTIPNLVITKVGEDGRVSLYNFGGTTHLLADVVGWYSATDAQADDRYNALPPARLLDTRDGGSPVASDAFVELQVTGRGGVPATRVSSVVLNVTATGGTASGFVTVHAADGQHRPLASNLNYSRGQTVANLVVAEVGPQGSVLLYNYGGRTHLVADVVGWFTTG